MAVAVEDGGDFGDLGTCVLVVLLLGMQFSGSGLGFCHGFQISSPPLQALYVAGSGIHLRIVGVKGS
ncbi:hypothetical protein ACFX15_013956 [Malus domestica]